MMFYHETPDGYVLDNEINYYSRRYHHWVRVPIGYLSDGATGAFDIFSDGWWVHDKLCDTGSWHDGSLLTNWQASMVLSDILWREGRYFRAFGWLFATFLFGGGKARKNGMFSIKKQG